MPTRKQVMRIFPQDIPEKIYYSISEVSEYTRVEPHVLRYWETKFGKLSPRRVGGNQRKYTRGDLDLIFVIIHLLYNEGYTLDGAEKKLRDTEAYEDLRRRYGVSGAGRRAAGPAPATAGTAAPPPAPPPAAERREPNGRKSDLSEIRRQLAEILDMLSD